MIDSDPMFDVVLALDAVASVLDDHFDGFGPSDFYRSAGNFLIAAVEFKPFSEHRAVLLEVGDILKNRSASLIDTLDDLENAEPFEPIESAADVGEMITLIGHLVSSFCRQIGYEAQDYEKDGVPKLTAAEAVEAIHDWLRSEKSGYAFTRTVEEKKGNRIRKRRIPYKWVDFVLKELQSAYRRAGESDSQGDRPPRPTWNNDGPFSGGER